MGINYAVSDLGDADGLIDGPIDQRTIDLAEALKMFVEITNDMGANLFVNIIHVDEARVMVYYNYYLGTSPSSNPMQLRVINPFGFFYQFEKDPEDNLDTFDKFVFAVSCIVKAVPWICSQQVLRRVVGGDKLAYQPA